MRNKTATTTTTKTKIAAPWAIFDEQTIVFRQRCYIACSAVELRGFRKKERRLSLQKLNGSKEFRVTSP